MPYVQREHDHIHNDPIEGPEPEAWDISALGDARVLGVYQYASSPQQSTAGGPALRSETANRFDQRSAATTANSRNAPCNPAPARPT